MAGQQPAADAGRTRLPEAALGVAALAVALPLLFPVAWALCLLLLPAALVLGIIARRRTRARGQHPGMAVAAIVVGAAGTLAAALTAAVLVLAAAQLAHKQPSPTDVPAPSAATSLAQQLLPQPRRSPIGTGGSPTARRRAR